MIFKFVRPCIKRAKILYKERPAVACIIDVLRGIYSWTGFPEDGVSVQWMASEL